MKDRICIVVVGYNRPDAMTRLLNSLSLADYLGDCVDLFISLDKGQKQEELINLANEFVWKIGEKRIRAFSEKQGLKNHVLQCGDLTNEYKAVVVLEDDLTVCENYYNYVRSVINYYDSNERIAGISLYKHQYCVDAGAFFEPAYNGYDVFLMQYAQSWGQCWTNKMWARFRKWYDENLELFESNDNKRLLNFPYNITTWSKQSWLKYFIAYVIENDLYFVYPYYSQTTNHSEAGEHNQIPNCDYQVALPEGLFEFRLAPVEQLVKYDAFFERIDLVIPQFKDKHVILDLYGRKRNFESCDILITSKALNYKIIYKWKLKLRPQETNCISPEEGNGIYVYDLHTEEIHSEKTEEIIRTRYDIRAINYRKLLRLGLAELNVSFTSKFAKKIKKH